MIQPRVIISSDRSNSGKTLISSGIMMALSKRFKVRGFKVGPDYIDGGYHKIATGQPSINLDLFMMGEDGVRESLARYSRGYDISVIEGVMGLYDGHGIEYSTYEVARVTGTPIVLVIDCSAMGSTAAAVIYGLKQFGNADVKGVIFNKIGSEKHYLYCKDKLRDVKALGYIPKLSQEIPSRHLGLFTVETYDKAKEAINLVSKYVETNIDMDLLMEIASQASPIKTDFQHAEPTNPIGRGGSRRIAAVAYDSAFSFYYQENLDILGEKFELKFFSPILNEKVENADLIYLGGGYPELYAEELSKSFSTAKWIKQAANDGKKVLAECGGLMYLSRYLEYNGRKYQLANLLDVGITFQGRLTLGYRIADTIEDSFISRRGDTINGHEFHVSLPEYVNEKRFVFKYRNGNGIENGYDGIKVNDTLASYLHLHFSRLRRRLSF
ncbi:cobyrinate a,c-diamide synthase [Metallosphaera tengchongensis]|uniref:Cobyrinate a,c-diamide synthase n=1 Tax=Metallosphaera tengchongensis TaxID=1532350 RepID=A0A6N0NSW0_9CREN|nr:cobyrinate a,c-diamide synthase [Metallosphaera tengchongensis]QKQ99825.1 cobyrinate a,c-diamide synthase [Metallosphaera tengchongensis]